MRRGGASLPPALCFCGVLPPDLTYFISPRLWSCQSLSESVPTAQNKGHSVIGSALIYMQSAGNFFSAKERWRDGIFFSCFSILRVVSVAFAAVRT